MSVLEYLSIPKSFQDEFEGWGVEFHDGDSADGGLVYEHYFYVPEEASDEILKEMGWERGQCIYVDPSAFYEEEPESPY
ncbi:MAG: hypothetical protein LRY74_10335 [Shewanella xiamenensis]|nr:hypothetical protein [Shewanella xiamenensis]